MFTIDLRNTARLAVLAGALIAGGCASTNDLKHAQATADQALAAAQSAGQRADAAMAAAQSAGQRADAAMTAANAAGAKADADAVNDKVDKMFAKSLKK